MRERPFAECMSRPLNATEADGHPKIWGAVLPVHEHLIWCSAAHTRCPRRHGQSTSANARASEPYAVPLLPAAFAAAHHLTDRMPSLLETGIARTQSAYGVAMRGPSGGTSSSPIASTTGSAVRAPPLPEPGPHQRCHGCRPSAKEAMRLEADPLATFPCGLSQAQR
jgi:hypothetical protein